ncbi:MAG: Hsp20/alpha crystallin family protein [Acidobacteriota bacterium]|nr:MAG: Hsp20/alpha crystallin family protein [Acidobacteriota bacterium]
MIWRTFGTDIFGDIRNSFRAMQREMDDLVRRTGWAGGGQRLLSDGTAKTSEGEDETLPFWRGYPAVDAWIDDDKLRVRAEVPGVDPAQIEVFVQEHQLVLRGRRREQTEKKTRHYLLREVGEGWFERRFTLPEDVDEEQIEASYDKGVLELTLRLTAPIEPRKIPIQIGSRTEQPASV